MVKREKSTQQFCGLDIREKKYVAISGESLAVMGISLMSHC